VPTLTCRYRGWVVGGRRGLCITHLYVHYSIVCIYIINTYNNKIMQSYIYSYLNTK